MKDKKDTSTEDFLLRFDVNNIHTEWSAPSEYPDLTKHKTIAVDLETRDPDLNTMGPGWATNNGEVVGVSVAAGDFYGYFPIRHANGPNMAPNVTLRWLREQMNTPDIEKVFHNASYDVGWLMAEDVPVQGKIIDTMLAAPVVDVKRITYGLDALGKEFLGLRKDEKILRAAAAEWGIDPKKEMWKLPARFVGGYAEQDAVLTLKLWNHLKTELDKQDLWAIFELESRVLPVLIKMRARGIAVDLDYAEQSRIKLRSRIKDIHAFIKGKTDMTVEPWAAESIRKIFDHLGLPFPMTEPTAGHPFGQPSFTKDFLKDHPDPVAQAINKLREADKADSTFIDSCLRFAHKGRIHCELNQLRSDSGGTVTGRLSSSNPNLQQLPARDPEIKELVRGIFIPEEGEQWVSFDYASQEPRLTVHYAASLGDRHRHPAIDAIVEQFQSGENDDLHQLVADMAGIERKPAKTINLGIIYGMGKAKLADQLSLSLGEAGELLSLYHKKVPFIKGLVELASRQAGREGQIRTVLGRLCHFDMWEPKTFGFNKAMKYDEAQKAYGSMGNGLRRAFTYRALNRLIQGSAADQTKLALVECDEIGFTPLIQVHDQLDFSLPMEGSAIKNIARVMETGVELKVPSKVDIKKGSRWGLVS